MGGGNFLQCLSMAKVVDLGVFLDPFTKSPGSFPNVVEIQKCFFIAVPYFPELK